MKAALKILRHMNVILAMMFGVFLVLDVYNPLMNFVNNDISRVLLMLWCALTVIATVIAWAEEPVTPPRKGRIAWARVRSEHPEDDQTPTHGWIR